MRIVLVVAKQLTLAKTRLAPAVPSPAEREALAEAMFRDVLAAALSARIPDGVAVVTSDEQLIAIGREAGAIIIDEEFPRGLNVAVRIATTRLIEVGATVIGTALSDIPLITGSDIDAAFAALPATARGVALVPSRDFSGTNMIVRTPPDAISTEFGHLSLVRHLEACRAASIACVIERLRGPALDLDVPDDLLAFARAPSMTHTYNHLSRLGLLHA